MFVLYIIYLQNPVPAKTLETVYKGLAQSVEHLRQVIESFQPRAAAVFTRASYDIRCVDLIDHLSWETQDDSLR